MLRRIGFLKRRSVQLMLVATIIVTLKLFGVFTHLFEKNYYTEFAYPYDGPINLAVQQLRYQPEIKPTIEPINRYYFKFIHNPKKKCLTGDSNILPVRLVYLVKSSLQNLNRRLAIRHSWGFENRFSDVEIRTFFLLGTTSDQKLQNKIDEESEKYRDIIQANFTDTYFNNTMKTMMGFKWAVSFCIESKFYGFIDDDFYVSTKNVLRFVRNPTNYPQYLTEPIYTLNKNSTDVKTKHVDFELPDDVRLYTGYVFFSAPHRHITSKWCVTLEEYPYNLWPPYVSAGAYILSRESLIEMYYTSFYTKHFKFDDVYVGLVAKKADIKPYHCENFYFYKQSYKPEKYKFTIASHGYGNPDVLLRTWNEQKSLGNA